MHPLVPSLFATLALLASLPMMRRIKVNEHMKY